MMAFIVIFFTNYVNPFISVSEGKLTVVLFVKLLHGLNPFRSRQNGRFLQVN